MMTLIIKTLVMITIRTKTIYNLNNNTNFKNI